MAISDNQNSNKPSYSTRAPLLWEESDFCDQEKLYTEMERIFNICHGCRRCVNLCQSFPTLFDLIDKSSSGEVDGVSKVDYSKVVDECYLCDLCYEVKCPYIPPHEWQVDFPHLMLRAKITAYNKRKSLKDLKTNIQDSIYTSPDMVGGWIASLRLTHITNRLLGNKVIRQMLKPILGLSPNAWVPDYLPKRRNKAPHFDVEQLDTAVSSGGTSGKVALFVTCYGSYHDHKMIEDTVAVYNHNGIVCEPVEGVKCCGIPKYELGDMKKVYELNKHNREKLMPYIDDGYDVVGMVPSCTLMMRRKVVSLFPNQPQVSVACEKIFDPAEYLMLRYKEGNLDINFKKSLGKISYHAACHLRVQNIGPKTRDLLLLIPDTEVSMIERCSGHDGTYGMRDQHNEAAVKMASLSVQKLKSFKPDFFTSDCMLAGHHIAYVANAEIIARHPMSLMRIAYGI